MSETSVPGPDNPDIEAPDVDDPREGVDDTLTDEQVARSAPEVGNDQDPASFLQP